MEETNGKLIPKGMGTFLTSTDEQLLLVQRKHWFSLVYPLAIIAILGSLFFFAAFALFFSIFYHLYLFIAASVIIFLILINTITKVVIDWYFHFYVVTTRKIIEASYAPLFSHIINEVLMDQVRCTEIDIQMEGILNELLDMGNVILTFDRPTHQEEFSLMNIHDPKKAGLFLGNILDMNQHVSNRIWFRAKDNPHTFRFTEEIFPPYAARIGGGIAR